MKTLACPLFLCCPYLSSLQCSYNLNRDSDTAAIIYMAGESERSGETIGMAAIQNKSILLLVPQGFCYHVVIFKLCCVYAVTPPPKDVTQQFLITLNTSCKFLY